MCIYLSIYIYIYIYMPCNKKTGLLLEKKFGDVITIKDREVRLNKHLFSPKPVSNAIRAFFI